MKNLNNFIQEKLVINSKTKLPHDKMKYKSLSFMDYEDVTQEMVDEFWEKPEYVDGLIPLEDIRPKFNDAYEIAKKNIAMLEYPMKPFYTVYFDKDGNLFIEVNQGASWSLQNHLGYYGNKYGKYFKLHTASGATINKDEYELIYDPEIHSWAGSYRKRDNWRK